MKRVLFIIFLLSFCSFSFSQTILVEEKEIAKDSNGDVKDKSNFSLLIPFTSYHQNNEIRAAVNQKNLGLGIRYQLSEDYYVQAVRVFRNSMDGKADSVGIGYDYYVSPFLSGEVRLGVELNFVKYEDRRGGITYRQGVPSLTTAYKYKDITFLTNIIPLKNNSVILFSLKIPFP